MNGKKLHRTVQYWRLVNAKDQQATKKDYDWDSIFRELKDKAFDTEIEKRKHLGLIYPLDAELVTLLKENAPAFYNNEESKGHYGIILAANKDYIPNQQDGKSGSQSPVSLNPGWEAVDNSFIWHLPFGNMFAIMLESQSSSRPAKYAAWISRLLQKNQILEDPNFRFDATPVVSKDVIDQINRATGMKYAILRTNAGKKSGRMNQISKMLSTDEFDDVELELKLKVKRGKAGQRDEAAILNWFNTNLGELDEFSKSQVKIIGADGGVTELDLIKQRLSRKKTIILQISDKKAGSIDKDAVFSKMIDSFIADKEELEKVQNDGR